MTTYVQQLLRRKFVQDTLILQVGKASVIIINLISAVLMARLMGDRNYGVWALAQSFFAIWQSLNLTGLGPSTTTRLAMATGARDDREILNLLGFYVQVSAAWMVFSILVMSLTGPAIARVAYSDSLHLIGSSIASIPHPGDPRIGILAALLTLTIGLDALYSMVLIVLQSRRFMREMAILLNVNQLVLTGCNITALFVYPTPEGLLVARIVYSVITMLIALWIYRRTRTGDEVVYPKLSAVFRHVRYVSPRPYWRFSFTNALDKNLSNLFTLVPIQVVGVIAGIESAGHLKLALSGLSFPGTLTNAIFDNLSATIPQSIGKRDYARLEKTVYRAALVMLIGGAVLHAGFALLMPWVVPRLFGAEWLAVIPLVAVLSLQNIIAPIGGIFNILCRAWDMLKLSIGAKIVTALLVALPSLWLVMRFGALGGAWMLNLLFILWAVLMVVMVLPTLRKRARDAQAS
jgi:O-antigen/teichoic acid export membrane protein